ncbi:MAG: phosphoglycerate dehydrogenase [Planctomycetes bacterium]|nr:phosphoglycerate dehydrogenase [Planctomycetota bacterium]
MKNRTTPAQFRVVICDELSPAALSIFREKGFEPEVKLGQTEAQLVALAPGVHAFVVRSATKITRKVIEAAPDLRVVGRAGVGVDNVDSDAATERGVVVMNTPTGNTVTTAELAITLLTCLARHVPRADALVKQGQWTKKGLTGTELTGKTLGIVGLGRIGRVVADRALGLKLNVVAHDPYLSIDKGSGIAGVELATLDTVLAASDFVTLHVPFMDSTRNIISKERIAKMKKGARLINAARGGLVDEAALLAALESGHLAGAALDVFTEEPPPKDHPLLKRADVIATPHLGASSEEAQFQVAVDIAHQICEFLVEGVAHNAVNAPAVSAQTLREIAPFTLLCERLGAFLAQVSDKPVRKLELTIAGDITKKDTRHLPLALLSAVLRHQGVDEGVNLVNAPVLAKERGIQLLESRESTDAVFQSAIHVRATCDEGETHTVSGAIFGRSGMIVNFDGLELDLEPKGAVLITRHDDQPGVVGMLGTILGSHRINIRRIELGPASHYTPGGRGLATGVLSLYEEPGQPVLAHLRSLEAVRDVRIVRL